MSVAQACEFECELPVCLVAEREEQVCHSGVLYHEQHLLFDSEHCLFIG